MDRSEKILIRKCIRGNTVAQKALYDRYAPTLYSICLRYAPTKEDAEDILQDGWVNIYKNLKQFKGKGSFEGWLKRIMTNEALAFFRKKSNLYSMVNLGDQDRDRVADNDLIDQIDQDELVHLIKGLPEGCRLIFNAYVVEGYSHKEIAERLNISVGTSKSQLHDARKMLKRAIENQIVIAKRDIG